MKKIYEARMYYDLEQEFQFQKDKYLYAQLLVNENGWFEGLLNYENLENEEIICGVILPGKAMKVIIPTNMQEINLEHHHGGYAGGVLGILEQNFVGALANHMGEYRVLVTPIENVRSTANQEARILEKRIALKKDRSCQGVNRMFQYFYKNRERIKTEVEKLALERLSEEKYKEIQQQYKLKRN